jgi:hypothetical protein
MKRDAVSGAALIVGTVSGLVTMALHPSGHQLMADYDRIAPLAVAVHVLALAGMPITFLGALGLTRRLSSETATAALVAYGFATVAAMSAAVASGLIAPHVAGWTLQAAMEDRGACRALLRYNGEINQAFAKVFVAASSVAILLWSLAILAARTFARAAGILGCLIGALALIGILSGSLRLDVHGFGLVVLAQGIWTLLVGVLLIRPAGQSSPTSRGT